MVSNVKGMKRKFKTALIYILQPRTVVLLVALFNFVWFFSQSSTVVEFGSNTHTFCQCPWYWEWSPFNLASFSLVATVSMFVARWKGCLVACLISGYQVIEGINWLSNASGFLGGFSQRFQVVSDSNLTNFWELLDVQYLLASIIFIASLIYLAKNIFDTNQKPTISYP